ncbi:MAG: hypothetical protein EU547_00920 [Promethearchaeota archaeon]|nr:MAG: hypothetical protein EU547_00920 [Candidatus Lokiarchaeota archaeon]
MKLIQEDSVQIEDVKIYLRIYKLHKSFLILLSNKEKMGIGDVTLGTPSKIEGIKSSSSTFNLFGVHNNLISSVIAKKSAFCLKQPVLVLFFCTVEVEENSFIKPLISFLNRNLNDIQENT